LTRKNLTKLLIIFGILLKCGTASADRYWVLGSFRAEISVQQLAEKIETQLGLTSRQQEVVIDGVNHFRLLVPERVVDASKQRQIESLGISPWRITLLPVRPNPTITGAEIAHKAPIPVEELANDSTVIKTLLWGDGTRYVGGVKDGKRFGQGTIFWQDGTRFVGKFVDDQRNGPGTMILPDGTVYTGYFENDTLVERVDGAVTTRSEPTPPVAEITAADVQKTVSLARPRAEVEPTPAPELITEEPAKFALVTRLDQATREQVQASIDLWAAAWSDKNTDHYLAIYSTEFAVPGRQSRRQWEETRRARLSRPSYIDVKVTYNSFDFVAPNTVQVDFNQAYYSNLYSDKTLKRLVMKKSGGLWRIISETSL
jgi:hypothetical protein